MAANSKIRFYKDGKQVRFQLNGDFDGSMALQLIGMIGDHCGRSDAVVIDTDDLRDLLPFGVEVFHKRLRTDLGFPLHCRVVGSKSALLQPH
ncbi:MAG: hypothetical protein ACOZF0_14300 [Thermodesulfobacteriota bacterium]